MKIDPEEVEKNNLPILRSEDTPPPLEKENPQETQRTKVYQFVGGATSFDEVDQTAEASKLSDDIFDLTLMFDSIAWNISNSQTDLNDKTAKGRMVLTEAKGLVDRIENLIGSAEDSLGDTDAADTSDADAADASDAAAVADADADKSVGFVSKVKEVLNAVGLLKASVKIVKEFQGFKLFKSSDGTFYLYGRPTNNIIDRENDILTTASHEEFIKFLDDNPDQAPELWTWHTPGTERKNKAHWWDFSDGFVHFFWELTDEEADGVEKFCDEFTPGMSHGFHPLGIAPGIKVLEKEGNLILKYRMVEASILPLEYAANPHTSFSIISA